MQTKTKQRAMGAVVMMTLVALALVYLFSHPLPGLTHDTPVSASANASEDGQVVYDLNLQAAKEAETSAEEDELVPLHPLTEEEMRQRASATNTVTEKLLRTSSSPMVIAEKQKETLKEALAQEDETLAELNHEDKNTTTVAAKPAAAPVAVQAASVVTAAAAPSAPAVVDSARDSAAKQVSSDNVPLAWVVQLGTFSDKQNAMRLVEVLRSMKLDVYTRTVGAAENSSIKVFVGPFIERQDVEKIQQVLERELNLKGVVKKYSLS